MKSKRAAIGSFISNYFSLIFLAIILGIFIFTSPFIKLAASSSESSTETLNLGGYSILFNFLNENIIDSEGFVSLPSQKLYPVAYSNTEGLYYFMLDDSNNLDFYIGLNKVAFDEIDLDYKNPATYYLENLEISKDNYFIISELKRNEKASLDEQLNILAGITEVSYEE